MNLSIKSWLNPITTDEHSFFCSFFATSLCMDLHRSFTKSHQTRKHFNDSAIVHLFTSQTIQH